jgi:hypothetical protein
VQGFVRPFRVGVLFLKLLLLSRKAIQTNPATHHVTPFRVAPERVHKSHFKYWSLAAM